MSEQMNEGARVWTISWEEAIEREMEYQRKMKNEETTEREMGYQKKMKNKLPWDSVDSRVSPAKSQEHWQKEKAIGLKRKATFQGFPEPSRKEFESQFMWPRSTDGQQNPSQRLCNEKPPSQLQDSKPPLQRAPLKVPAIHRCTLCNVSCMTSSLLKLHLEGKKHKARLEEVHGSKKNSGQEEIWCPECNVKCMNDFSWKQHLMGWKHLARIGKKAVESSDAAGPVIKTEKAGCGWAPQKAHHFEEQETRKTLLSLSDNVIMSSTFQHKKLRTSNWPNFV